MQCSVYQLILFPIYSVLCLLVSNIYICFEIFISNSVKVLYFSVSNLILQVFYRPNIRDKVFISVYLIYYIIQETIYDVQRM